MRKVIKEPKGERFVGAAEAALAGFAAFLSGVGVVAFACSGKWHCLIIGCMGASLAWLLVKGEK